MIRVQRIEDFPEVGPRRPVLSLSIVSKVLLQLGEDLDGPGILLVDPVVLLARWVRGLELLEPDELQNQRISLPVSSPAGNPS